MFKNILMHVFQAAIIRMFVIKLTILKYRTWLNHLRHTACANELADSSARLYSHVKHEIDLSAQTWKDLKINDIILKN